MNTLMKIFLWFSNTDPEIYKMCKSSVRWQRQSLSLFVLITGLFALIITGTYFVSTLFTTYNEAEKVVHTSTQGWIISSFMGAIWMLMIIYLNKTIISARKKWIAIIRIPLAILIGLAISAPLELQLFNKEITKTLIFHNQEIIALNHYKQHKIEQSFDFASQYEQFCSMIQDPNPKNRNLKHLAYAIIILFILIELTPALMKISGENDTYEYLLVSGTFQEAQSINAKTDQTTKEVQSIAPEKNNT